MTTDQENYRARNLCASLFGELPEHSNIQKLPNKNTSKYQDDADDEFFQLDLGDNSVMVPRVVTQVNTVTSSNDSRTKKSSPESTAPVSRIQRKGGLAKSRSKVKGEQQKKREVKKDGKEVDIDAEIGEVAEWKQRGAKDQSDEEDFEEEGKGWQTKQQLQIRKKLEQKLKNNAFQKKNNGGLGGLKAKAEQLRKINEVNEIRKDKDIKEVKQQFQVKAENNKAINSQKENKFQIKTVLEETVQSNNSSIHLGLQKKNEKMFPQKMDLGQDEDEDDPWQKVNEETKNHQKQQEANRRQLTVQKALQFYKKFQFDEKDIEDELAGGRQIAQKEEIGCFQSIFVCFQSEKAKKPRHNLEIGKRLVAISRKQLGNGDEEYLLLKKIWDELTKQPFSRFGSQWNQVGFQGRDPATDLRSTGILSLLQWVQFLQKHPRLAQKYYVMSIQKQFPLALTHIKATGAFLELLKRGKLVGASWDDLQNGYNCLAICLFNKLLANHTGGLGVGSLVEQSAKQLRGEYGRLRKQYDEGRLD